MNLVWVDDVATAIARAFDDGVTGVYNVSGVAPALT